MARLSRQHSAASTRHGSRKAPTPAPGPSSAVVQTVFAMPTTYFVDKKGVIAKRHIGFNPETAPEEIEHTVRGLLGLD